MSGKPTNPTKPSGATAAAIATDQSAAQTDADPGAAVTHLAQVATTAISDLAASAQTLIAGSADQSATNVADRLVGAASDAITYLVQAAKEQLQALADGATPVQASAELVAFTPGLPSSADSTLSAEDVAKLVKRRTVIEDKGASREIVTPLRPSEILSWHDHGSHIVVVTVDGQKFSSAAAE